MNNLIDNAVGLLAPLTCVGCGAEGAILCDICLLSAGEPHVPRCAGCKQLSEGYSTCRRCRRWLSIAAVYPAAPYEGVYKQLLHAYKFDCQRACAREIATIMAAVLPTESEFDAVCCVPTAPARRRSRGFDHAELLADAIAKRVGVTSKKLLTRRHSTRQVGSARIKRFQQMNAEIETNKKCEYNRVLLVDDIMTTGASLSAAAKALKAAGVKEVYAVIFA